MTHGDPKPQNGIEVVRPPWPFEVLRTLVFETTTAAEAAARFDDVLAARRSRRDIGAVPVPAAAAVIRQALAINGVGAGRRRKTSLSAGALHPISCVFFRTGRVRAFTGVFTRPQFVE
jgi:hypothetical protein